MSYSNINRVVLVGRLTSDPELRSLPSGTSVCGLRLACNATRKNADGDYTEKPNFFNVSVFGATGESVHRYMSRGRRVAIDGRLDWREWETPDGRKAQAVSVIANNLQFLGSPRSESNGAAKDGEDEVLEGIAGGEEESLDLTDQEAIAVAAAEG